MSGILMCEFDVIENSNEKIEIRYSKDWQRTGLFQIVFKSIDPSQMKALETSKEFQVKLSDVMKLLKVLDSAELVKTVEIKVNRLQKLNRLVKEIYKLKKKNLHLQKKSFKFEFKGFDFPNPEDERGVTVGVFEGRLIIPPQDYDLFNVGCVDNRPGAGPDHKYLPLLHRHNPLMVIGAVHLMFVHPRSPAGTHFPSANTPLEVRKQFERYEWKARVTLVFVTKKAKEIYASIKKRGQKAIKELEVGYRIEKPVPPRNLTTFIYEVSIKGGQ